MILKTTTQAIEAVSDAGATTKEPQVFADYIDVDTAKFKMVGAAPQATNLNGTTTVDVVSPPAQDVNRHLKYLNVYNADTVAHDITVKFDDNGTEYILLDTTFRAGQTISWTRERGWADNVDLLSLFSADNEFTGVNQFQDLIAGDPGFEGTGITIGGVTYDSVFKASDIGSSNIAQVILHRHSTTLQPLIVGARAHSNTSSHTIVQNGDGLFSIFAVGWDGVDYAIGAEIAISVEGTPGAGDMPTQMDFKVSPDGSETPVTQFTIHENGELECIGIPTLPTYTVAGVPSASTYTRGLIYVSDETGGAIPAFSDGTNWRRVTDRAVVS